MRRDLSVLGQNELNMRKMFYDAYDGLFDLDKGKFLNGNKHLITSRKFDTLISRFIITSGYLKGRNENTIRKSNYHFGLSNRTRKA